MKKTIVINSPIDFDIDIDFLSNIISNDILMKNSELIETFDAFQKEFYLQELFDKTDSKKE